MRARHAGADVYVSLPIGLSVFSASISHIITAININNNRRQWYLGSVACGADASWGALAVAMRELNVTQTDLESAQWIGLDATMEQR